MFKKIGNRKAQNTAEYAILIALVVGAIIAMQTYAQRGLQARMRGSSIYMKNQMASELSTAGITGYNLGTTGQYEPYYQHEKYSKTLDTEEETIAHASGKIFSTSENVNRKKDAYNKGKDTGYAQTNYLGTTTQD